MNNLTTQLIPQISDVDEFIETLASRMGRTLTVDEWEDARAAFAKYWFDQIQLANGAQLK